MKYRALLKGLGLLIMPIFIAAFGWILKLAIDFYRAIYPEVYSREIVGRLSRVEDISWIERTLYIAIETWPVTLVIVFLSFLVLALCVVFIASLTGLFFRKRSSQD